MCNFVHNFIRRCVRDDPYMCWQNIGAGKYRTSRRLRPFSAHFQTKADMAWHLKESFICQPWRIRKKWSTFDLRLNSIILFLASVGVSYVATQFHVSNSDGRMSKGVKTSQRCEWFIVTSRNVTSKINVKPSKVQISISFLIIWILWSNKNEFTLHIMTCMKITESQNGLIYPEDTFSHGAAHI